MSDVWCVSVCYTKGGASRAEVSMATNDRAAGRAGRGRGAGAQGKQGTEEGGSQGGMTPSGMRIMAAFRIPKPLHSAMTQESRAEGLDLTAYVNRLFDGFLH